MVDAVYRSLLPRLTLSATAADALRIDRQLSDETVAKNLYASVPRVDLLASHCDEIAARCSVEGVPGFFRRGSRWLLNAAEGELLIPVRDAEGRLVGCQLRSDRPDRRYRWLSSTGKTCGASPGAPVHFAAPDHVQTSGVALLTEGVLKADCIAESLRCAVIGLPGASAFTGAIGDFLRTELPSLDHVRVAFDADASTKPAVYAALLRLVASLQRAGLTVSVLRWNGTLGKGLDDVLHGRARAFASAVGA